MAIEIMPGARLRPSASVTLVALCLTTVLGMALGSYLGLCTRSYEFSTRTFYDTTARELAQTGLEEALWALNQDDWSSSGPASNTAWTTNAADRSVTLSYGSLGPGISGEVTLTVANYAAAGPIWPSITSAATIARENGRTFSATLQAATGPAPLFGNAIASADAYVSFTAGGSVDSWDSDPDNNPSTPAVAYSFAAGDPANYAAVVAGNDNGAYGVILNQASIKGYVATFGKPVSYSTSGAPPGQVIGPATPPGLDVDPGRLGQSAFVPVAPVFAITPPPSSGPNFGGVVNNILDLASLLLSAPPEENVYKTSGDLTILGIPLVSPSLVINRSIKLIVTGSLAISGAGQITITPAGSLEIFVADDVTLGGNGIDNQTLDSRKFALFCTSNSAGNSLEYTSTADFRGVIYCENKPIDIRQNATFYGALLSRGYVRFSNNATNPVFHYDTALRRTRFSGVATPFVINRLTEP